MDSDVHEPTAEDLELYAKACWIWNAEKKGFMRKEAVQ